MSIKDGRHFCEWCGREIADNIWHAPTTPISPREYCSPDCARRGVRTRLAFDFTWTGGNKGATKHD